MSALPAAGAESLHDVIRRLLRRELREGDNARVHPYRTADNAELFSMVRLCHADGSKDMRPIHRNGSGRYTSGRGPKPSDGWPLYRLPELVPADVARPVWIAEGESCADALRKLGLCATTSGSATSADGCDWAPMRGRSVTLWPDNDEPGGRYALDVVRHLRALGCTVRLMAREVVEALPAKGDVVDWLAAHPGATRADVEALPTVPAPEAAEPDAWPEPTPLPDALPPVQPFDAELLPASLRGWIADIAERMQCPPDFPAVGALVALSGLVGARAVMAPKERDDWRVVPNLWGLIVGRPGVMKSPALGEVLKPLQRLEKAARERWEAAHAEWETESRIDALQAKADEKAAAAAIAKKDASKARALLTAATPRPEPTMRRYLVNDSTQEKLADLLTVNPRGVLVYRDELHGLIRGMDREGQEGARGFYLTGADGLQGYAVDRIGRGESYVPRVCLALLGGMQPGKVQRYVRDAVTGGSGDDGLLQRFGLAVWPDISADWRRVDRWPDTEAKRAAWAVFERLDGLQTPDDAAPAWKFIPEAQGLYWEWAEPFERELRGAELHPALASHLAKYRKLIPALALLFALADASNDARTVAKPELLRALAWSDYLRTHAERLYAAATMPETAGAEALLAKLRAGKLTGADGKPAAEFTPRAVAVKHWAGLTTPADVRKAAELLAEYGWVRLDGAEPADEIGRGRPSERYILHPMLLAGGAS